MRAWVSERGGSWVVYWNDHDGRRRQQSCGVGRDGQKLAEKFRQKKNAELLLGIDNSRATATWREFRERYENTVLDDLAASTRRIIRRTLNDFERLAKPGKICNVTAETIARFASLRRKERGKLPGSTLTATALNKQLRHLKAVLSIAEQWGYLARAPVVRMAKAVKRLPRYMPPEVFVAVYEACKTATEPAGQPYEPADWWRGLMIFAQMHGWRIGELLSLQRADVDLDRGFALIRGERAKGRADAMVKLHPVVVEHLRRLPGFTPTVFPWPHYERKLWEAWTEIQTAAGVEKSYGFHAIRKACGTLNAPRVQSPATLKHLMRHAALATTMEFYTNPLADQEEAVGRLYVPDVKRAAK